jgi:hypothetical protein
MLCQAPLPLPQIRKGAFLPRLKDLILTHILQMDCVNQNTFHTASYQIAFSPAPLRRALRASMVQD